MNYLEIIEWIQNNVLEIKQMMNERYLVTYINPRGASETKCGENLISIILEINDVDFI